MCFNKAGIFALLFLFLGCGLVMGQQKSHYSMYPMNRYLVNPAIGGSNDYAKVNAGYRNQWVGLANAPTTYYVSGHTPLNKRKSRFDDLEDVDKLPWHGVGGYIVNDETGMVNRSLAYFSYSYHFPVTKDITVSGGVFVGGQQYRLSTENLEFHDERLGISEPTIQGNNSTFVPDASMGIYVTHPDFFFGISSFQLFENRLKFNGVPVQGEEGKLARHYFATGGYTYEVNEDWEVIPSFMIKALQPAPISFDINARARYMEKFWAGLSYRNQDAIVGMAGATIDDKYEVGYAYDFTTSGLSDYSSGSHEIMLGYRFGRVEEISAPAQPW